jgi:hypothetical protein
MIWDEDEAGDMIGQETNNTDNEENPEMDGNRENKISEDENPHNKRGLLIDDDHDSTEGPPPPKKRKTAPATLGEPSKLKPKKKRSKRPLKRKMSTRGSQQTPQSSNNSEVVFLGYSRPKSIFADYYVGNFLDSFQCNSNSD